MIFTILLKFAGIILGAVLAIFQVQLNLLGGLTSSAYDVSLGAAFVFGNIAVFNSIFPVTELLVLAAIGLSIKGALIVIKITLAVASFTKKAWDIVVRFRI